MKKKSIHLLLGVAALLLITSCNKDEDENVPVVRNPKFGVNLLENPGAETGDLSGWDINRDGGDGWAVKTSGDVHSGTYEFATSFSVCRRSQKIDLIAAGFTASELDAAPAILVSEWFRQFYTKADNYSIKVDLLDESNNVIDNWSVSGTTTDASWFNLTKTFTSYGPGLRYIYFEDSGEDTEYWAGHYGVRMDDAKVILQ